MTTYKYTVLLFSILTISLLLSIQSLAKNGDPVTVGDTPDLYAPPDMSEANQVSTTAKMHQKPKEISHWSVMIPTAVLHGTQPAGDAAQSMNNKITANGDAVWTPGVALEYISPNGALLLGALVEDCYNHYTGTFEVGKDYRINRDSHWAWSMGVYVRPTPLDCSTPGSYNGCALEDSMSQYFVSKTGNGFVDVIPMPFLHYNTVLYQDKHFEVRLKVLANVILNEVGLEIPL